VSIDLPQELIPAGSRVGKYEVVRRLAYGGMAEIYLVRVSGIQGFEKHVVLKRILPQFAAREDFLQMFLQEARLAATLDQANIAHVYDIGEIGGSYFYTMEYLHGEDLRRIVKHLLRAGGRLPLAHALGIAAGVAGGLHYAHEKRGPDGRPLGIVHRDVSPSNVVVTFGGDVKLVDFGIAKMTADGDLTRGGRLKGKVAYMSPEQLHGRPVDRRSDVFSLGVVLYEITTHRRLFSGENDVDVMRAAMEGEVPLPTFRDPEYPRDLEQVVMRALERDPARRHPTARDLQRDIEAVALAQRAQISSAALADWMAQTFGHRPEPWLAVGSEGVTAVPAADSVASRASLEAAPPAAPRAGAGADPATKVVVREDVIVVPSVTQLPVVVSEEPTPGGTAPCDSSDTPATTMAPQVSVRPRTSVRRLVAGAITGFVLIAAAVAGLIHVRQREAVASFGGAGGAAPVLLLVAEGGHVAVDREGAGAAAPAAAPPPVDEAPKTRGARPIAPANAARAKGATAGARVVSRGAVTPAPTTFSAALARRSPELRSCFAASRSPASDDSAIEFRFRVRTDGHVESVSVLPETVAGTPLGACLAKVGAGTVFAPQAEPVAFRIPLSLRLHQAATNHRP
jgi:tRNA A-37 threonylcarbamoyl transferase component Bud32